MLPACFTQVQDAGCRVVLADFDLAAYLPKGSVVSLFSRYQLGILMWLCLRQVQRQQNGHVEHPAARKSGWWVQGFVTT